MRQKERKRPSVTEREREREREREIIPNTYDECKNEKKIKNERKIPSTFDTCGWNEKRKKRKLPLNNVPVFHLQVMWDCGTSK
jgi:hypothetical protein